MNPEEIRAILDNYSDSDDGYCECIDGHLLDVVIELGSDVSYALMLKISKN